MWYNSLMEKLKKIIWRFISKHFESEVLMIGRGADNIAIQNWLFGNFKDKGWMHYYTVRRRAIMEVIATGLQGDDYWKNIGRLEELKSLANLIKDEAARRDRLSKKTK